MNIYQAIKIAAEKGWNLDFDPNDKTVCVYQDENHHCYACFENRGVSYAICEGVKHLQKEVNG